MALKDVAGIALWEILHTSIHAMARDMQQGTHGTLYCFPVRLSMTVNESSRCCLAFDAGVSWPMLLHFALGFVARMVPGQRMLIYIQDC